MVGRGRGEGKIRRQHQGRRKEGKDFNIHNKEIRGVMHRKKYVYDVNVIAVARLKLDIKVLKFI